MNAVNAASDEPWNCPNLLKKQSSFLRGSCYRWLSTQILLSILLWLGHLSLLFSRACFVSSISSSFTFVIVGFFTCVVVVVVFVFAAVVVLVVVVVFAYLFSPRTILLLF